MPLREHLRELRRRLFRAALGVAAGGVVGWFLYDWVFTALQTPIRRIAHEHGREAVLNFAGVASSFDIKIKVSLWIGLLISSPVWIYQLWAFVTPGLTRKERRYAVGFVAAAVPLFAAGGFIAWKVLPNAVGFLTAFTPQGAANIIDVREYISFVTRIILAFGIAFLLPVILVALNFAGLMTGRTLLKGWRIATFLVFLFAAVATPTPDATSMIALALPMVALYMAAVGIAMMNDRRRAARSAEPDYAGLSDDEASPL